MRNRMECSITDGPQYDDSDRPEQDPDRAYESARQERDDDLVAALRDIASIRPIDFFADQAE